MTQKMQAAQVEHFGQPLVLKELDIPGPGVHLETSPSALRAKP